MRLIERLFDNYVYASDKEWIRDKVAWALYQTWREADARKSEPTISKMEQVEQRSCDTCKNRDVEGWKNPCLGCIGFVFYEPKDEPQTHDICTNTHECVKDTHDKDEPQTEDEILREQVRAFMGIVEQMERGE